MKKIIVLALSVACFAACKKSNSADTLPPVVSITSPSANQQFGAGATINITGTIYDNRELHSVHVIVVNKTTNAEVLHFEEHVDVQTYEVNKSFVAAAATVYVIHVEGEDHTGHHAQAELEVRAN
ncbi:MAG: Ig-like domain-containing protein [Chitinophagaceae bacterium]